MRQKVLWLIACFGLALLCCVGPLNAQRTAALVGTIADPSRAVIRAATVTATHVETNQKFTTVTSSSGDYALPSLSEGQYVIAAALVSAQAGAVESPSGNAASADLLTLQHRLADPQPITWLFTGDSVTQGAKWVGGDRIYSEIIFERVRWEMSRKRDIVINTAISGNKTDDILADFAWRVGHLHPDVVSLMIGMNDSVRGRAGERQFEANLVDLVARIRALGAIPILQTTNTTMLDPKRADLPAYNAIIEKVAQEQKVILVDNWKYWQRSRTADNLGEWLGERIHPNGRGHAAIAEEFFRTLGIYDPDSPMCKLGP